MGDVFDLDALEREAREEPFTFRFDGREYVLPPAIDVRAATALEGGRIEEALRLLLGREQWAQLQQADGVFDTWLLMRLLEAYAKHTGVELPE